MQLSSPKAAPGTTATRALSSSQVQSSVEFLTVPPKHLRTSTNR